MTANRVRRRPPPVDSSVQASRDSALAAENSAWASLDTSKVWFERARSLDLTGDGRPEWLVLRAKGPRGDSLMIRLIAVVGNDSMNLEAWRSDYELIDPPFPRDTAQAVVDAYMQNSLRNTIDGASTKRDPLALGDLTGPDDGCAEGSDGCLLENLNGDTTAYFAVREEFKNKRPVRLSYNYGYESSIEVVWSAKLRRFLVVFACC